MRMEIDGVAQAQAVLEAIMVLEDAGFVVGNFSIETEVESSDFGLHANLSINQDERPLANVD